MKKRAIAAILAGITALSTMTGCGSQGGRYKDNIREQDTDRINRDKNFRKWFKIEIDGYGLLCRRRSARKICLSVCG